MQPYENLHDNVKIFLVRHGESASNKIIHANKKQGQTLSAEHERIVSSFKDPGLTDLGNQQAARTAAYLVSCVDSMKPNNVHILASPYERAMNTCRPFSGQTGRPITVLNELREYTEEEKMSDVHVEAGMIPDASWSSFTDRVKSFANTVRQIASSATSNDIIVIYGHSLYFSCLLSYIGSNQTWIPDSGTTVFKMPNCCISSLGFCTKKKKWSIYNVAYKGHLDNLATGHHVPLA